MSTTKQFLPENPGGWKQYLGYYVIGVIAAVIAFIILSSLFDYQTDQLHQALHHREETFLSQVVGATLAGQIDQISRQMQFLAGQGLPELMTTEGIDLEGVKRLFAAARVSTPETAALLYLDEAGAPLYIDADNTASGTAAREIGLEWQTRYQDTVQAEQATTTPPFHLTPAHQFYGLLKPVTGPGGDRAGLLVMVIDMRQLAERFLSPVLRQETIDGYLLDEQGNIIYSQQPEKIGRNLYQTQTGLSSEEMQRLVQQTQSDTGPPQPWMAAEIGLFWQPVKIGQQTLIVLLHRLSVDNWFLLNTYWPRLVGGGILALTVVGLGLLLTHWQQTAMTKTTEDLQTLVEQRTREMLVNETRYQRVFENAPLGIITCDRQGKIAAVNPALLEILGSPGEEETMKINLLTFPPLVEAGISGSIRRCMEQNQAVIVEHEYTSKWGKISHLRLHITPRREPLTGEVKGMQALVEDISTLKQTENALRESEQMLQTILDSITDYVWSAELVEGQVKYRYYSSVVETITGYPPEYFMQGLEAWLDIIHPADRAMAAEKVGREFAGETVTHEYRIIRPDDQVKWLYGTTSPMFNEAGQVVELVGVVSDITQRKQLEERLRQSQKMEAIGTLAGGIAHDFNNMLTAIMGYAGMGIRSLPAESEAHNDFRGIQKTARRAANLVEQLLAFSRRQAFEPQLVNLNELILELDEMLRRLISKNIEFVTVPGAALGWVKVDPGQIEQVLVNLVINARDAMPNGGKLIIETTNVSLTRPEVGHLPEMTAGEYVLCIVSDNGTGMPEAVQEHIFEPFFTTKEVGKGVGLGLSTCFGIVRQSNGHIFIESEEGRGTIAKIYLPRVESIPEAMVQAQNQTQQSLSGGHETILLVEDELTVRQLAARVLRQQGYSVLEANHGEEALRRLMSQGPEIDLLLTDLVMPKMGGLELVEEIRKVYGPLKFPVLFISGYSDQGVEQKEVQIENKTSFLQKPFTPETLARKVRQILGRSDLTSQ